MPRAKCGFSDDPSPEKPRGSELLVALGPSVLIDVGFDAAFVPAQGGVPTPAITGLWALIDTGATESCIDSQLATQLSLPVIDKRKIGGSAGAHEVNIHLAQVHIPSLNFTLFGAFAAVHLVDGGLAHRALLGRTFLRHFTMIYNGTTGDVEIYS